ncbi:MAG: CapA family protein [Bacillota bacterium]
MKLYVVVAILIVVTAVSFSGSAAPVRADPSGQAAGEAGTSQVTLAFVGDIMLALRVADLIAKEGTDYPWRQVAPVLQAADLAVGNLECAVGTTGQPVPGKKYTFRAPPVALEGLARAGIDVVGLANNHALDYGQDCFLETLDNLKRAGVAYVGGGRNLEEAGRPYITELKGIKVGILGVCLHLPAGWGATAGKPGLFSGFDTPRLLKAIRDLDSQVDWTVVFVHWGVERADHPEKWHRTLAEQMLAAGADLIIGHHPHVWQGIDRREKSLVAYSLGNFIFTIRPEFPQQQQTGILLVTLTRDRIREVRVVPAHIPRAGETVLVQGDAAARMWDRIDRLSAPFATYVAGDGTVKRAAFADVRDHWAREYIGTLAARGIVAGDGAGRYRPQDSTTYAGLLTMLVRALRLPDSPQTVLPPELGHHWVAPYLRAAVGAGLWPAEEVASFPADAPIPRWKAAQTLAATMKVGGRPLPAVDSLPNHADLGEAPRPSLDAIARVSAAGLMRGYPDGRFGPNDPLTRAEAACIVLGLIQKLEQSPQAAAAAPADAAPPQAGAAGPP